MKKQILITLMVLSFSVTAEDLGLLYAKFIPSAITQNQSNLEMFSGLIAQKAAVHPELIYFLLKRTAANYDSTLSNTERKLLIAKLRQMEQDYLKTRNEWVQRELDLMQVNLKKSIDEDLQDQTKAYLQSMIAFKKDPFEGLGAWGSSNSNASQNKEDTIDSTALNSYNLTIDHNLMDYFVLLYHIQDYSMPYDANTSYKTARLNAGQNIRNVYSTAYQELDNRNGQLNKNEIDIFLHQWYLFQQDEISQNEDTAQSFYAYEFIIRFLKNYYRQNTIKRFSIAVDYIFDSNPTIESDIPVEGYTGDVNFQINKVNKQIGLSVTYRQMFDNYVHLLSYLSIQASITSRSVRDELLFFDPGFSSGGFKQTGVGTRISESLEFETGEIANFSMRSYSLKLAVPVFTYKSSFVLETGFITKYNKLNFDITYDYAYSRVEQGPLIGGGWATISRVISNSGIVEEEKELEETSFFPVIDLNYNLNRVIGLSASLVPKYMSFHLMVNF